MNFPTLAFTGSVMFKEVSIMIDPSMPQIHKNTKNQVRISIAHYALKFSSILNLNPFKFLEKPTLHQTI